MVSFSSLSFHCTLPLCFSQPLRSTLSQPPTFSFNLVLSLSLLVSPVSLSPQCLSLCNPPLFVLFSTAPSQLSLFISILLPYLVARQFSTSPTKPQPLGEFLLHGRVPLLWKLACIALLLLLLGNLNNFKCNWGFEVLILNWGN